MPKIRPFDRNKPEELADVMTAQTQRQEHFKIQYKVINTTLQKMLLFHSEVLINKWSPRVFNLVLGPDGELLVAWCSWRVKVSNKVATVCEHFYCSAISAVG